MRGSHLHGLRGEQSADHLGAQALDLLAQWPCAPLPSSSLSTVHGPTPALMDPDFFLKGDTPHLLGRSTRGAVRSQFPSATITSYTQHCPAHILWTQKSSGRTRILGRVLTNIHKHAKTSKSWGTNLEVSKHSVWPLQREPQLTSEELSFPLQP